MVGNISVNSAKIRGYILTRYKLGLGAMEIYKEICEAYGYNEVSYTTITRWIRKFKSGQESCDDAMKSG